MQQMCYICNAIRKMAFLLEIQPLIGGKINERLGYKQYIKELGARL